MHYDNPFRLGPSVIQEVLDRIFYSESFNKSILISGIIIIGAMFLVKEVLNCLRIRTNNKLEQKVIFNIRKDLHDKLLDLPVSFYDKRKSGEIASRVVEDVQNVERAILDGTEQGSNLFFNISRGNYHDVYSGAKISTFGVSSASYTNYFGF